MQDNYEIVQKGFRILHPLMTAYIGREMNRVYHDGWWQQVLMTLSDQSKLTYKGDSRYLFTMASSGSDSQRGGENLIGDIIRDML